MILDYSLKELPDVANKIIQDSEYKILLFDAEMGVGKTTLIREICKQLGVEDTISSPTYSLVNEYEGKQRTIFHFDFYRIKDETETFDIGFEEYMDSDAWIFIEWPDKIANLLPPEVTKIQISMLENGKRSLRVS